VISIIKQRVSGTRQRRVKEQHFPRGGLNELPFGFKNAFKIKLYFKLHQKIQIFNRVILP
jgi:hypothetical protein